MNAEVQPWAALPTPPPWRGDLSPYRVGQGPPLPVALSGFQLMQITQQAQGAAPWARLARRPRQRPLGGRDRWTEGRGCGQQGALEKVRSPLLGRSRGGGGTRIASLPEGQPVPPASAGHFLGLRVDTAARERNQGAPRPADLRPPPHLPVRALPRGTERRRGEHVRHRGELRGRRLSATLGPFLRMGLVRGEPAPGAPSARGVRDRLAGSRVACARHELELGVQALPGFPAPPLPPAFLQWTREGAEGPESGAAPAPGS